MGGDTSVVNMSMTAAAMPLVGSPEKAGLMDLVNRQPEKMLDETDVNLDMTRTDIRATVSPSKKTKAEHSFDQAYLSKIDDIENENK